MYGDVTCTKHSDLNLAKMTSVMSVCGNGTSVFLFSDRIYSKIQKQLTHIDLYMPEEVIQGSERCQISACGQSLHLSLTHSLTHSPAELSDLSMWSVSPSFTRSLTHSFTRCDVRSQRVVSLSLSHSFTHSFIHSLIHSIMREKSTNNRVNQRSEDVTQTQTGPESPTVTHLACE